MKKVFFILSVLMCMMFTACQKQEFELNITAFPVVFDAAGGTKEIFSSNLELELSGIPEWLSVSQKNVDGRFVCEAACAANESADSRRASITYHYERKKACSKQEANGAVPVTQLGKAD